MGEGADAGAGAGAGAGVGNTANTTHIAAGLCFWRTLELKGPNKPPQLAPLEPDPPRALRSPLSLPPWNLPPLSRDSRDRGFRLAWDPHSWEGRGVLTSLTR